MLIEESVLSHLTTSENVKKASDIGLNAKHFVSLVNKSVFEFIIDYWADSSREFAPTEEVIKQQFPEFKRVEPEETLTWLVQALKKRYKYSAITDTLQEVAGLADDGLVDAALKVMSAQAFDIIQSTVDRQSFADISENVEDRRARYVERASFDGKVKGAPLGLPEVDEFTFGILPGEICSMVGSPGTGKTWTIVSAALAGMRAGFDPYVESLELSRQDIEDRIDALAARVSHERIYRGSLGREELDRLRQAQDDLREFGSLFVDSPDEDGRTVQAMVTRAREKGSKYLIIDQLSFVQGKRDRYNSPKERITENMRDLHLTISEGEKLSVLLAVQFNREQKKSGRTELHNIADATEIEQFTDLAFGLNQTKEMRANNAMELILMKFRRGRMEKWLLNWNLGENIDISVLERVGFDV